MMHHPDAKIAKKTYSQHGEDMFIWNLFVQLGFDPSTITYLDLGAHHPEIISNTKLFYDAGAHGVNVEANPYMFEFFKTQRTRDINLNFAVGPKECKATMYIYDDVSPCNTLSYEESTKLRTASGLFGQNREIEIQAKTINQLARYLECPPDFINCDVEGLDFEVMQTMNFDNWHREQQPKVICVEVCHSQASKMRWMMQDKGYWPYTRICANVIYVHNFYYDALLIRGLGRG